MTPSTSTIEDRLAKLENEVAELKQKARADQPIKTGWHKKIKGTFKDDPEFDEIIRLGREIRQADRPPQDDDR